MKRYITFALVACCVAALAGLVGCGKEESYTEQMAALSSTPWYFEGENDTLGRLTFTGDTATIDSVSFDGNGAHNGASTTATFTIDDTTITLEAAEDKEATVIPYTFENGEIVLNRGAYLSEEHALADLQGSWTLLIYHYGLNEEYNLAIGGNNITYDKATEAGKGAGVYYYFGPYEGRFNLGFGTFETDMRHGGDLFWRVINGFAVPMHYDSLLEHGEGHRV